MPGIDWTPPSCILFSRGFNPIVIEKHGEQCTVVFALMFY
jgi:hypothetical protein